MARKTQEWNVALDAILKNIDEQIPLFYENLKIAESYRRFNERAEKVRGKPFSELNRLDELVVMYIHEVENGRRIMTELAKEPMPTEESDHGVKTCAIRDFGGILNTLKRTNKSLATQFKALGVYYEEHTRQSVLWTVEHKINMYTTALGDQPPDMQLLAVQIALKALKTNSETIKTIFQLATYHELTKACEGFDHSVAELNYFMDLLLKAQGNGTKPESL